MKSWIKKMAKKKIWEKIQTKILVWGKIIANENWDFSLLKINIVWEIDSVDRYFGFKNIFGPKYRVSQKQGGLANAAVFALPYSWCWI